MISSHALHSLSKVIAKQHSSVVYPGERREELDSGPPSEWLGRLITRGESHVIVEAVGAETAGIVTWQSAPWDTTILGRHVARLDHILIPDELRRGHPALVERIVERTREDLKANGIEYALARIPAEDVVLAQAMEVQGFKIVDGIITFACQASTTRPAPIPSLQVRGATDDDTEAVVTLAGSAFSRDRFHQDPEISDSLADQVHREWARNACLGKVADVVLVAEDDEGICGFLSCGRHSRYPFTEDRHVAVIGLVATASRARGRGVASILTQAAVNWALQVGAKWVVVGTQFANVGAARLYQRCGFSIVSTSHSLRVVMPVNNHAP